MRWFLIPCFLIGLLLAMPDRAVFAQPAEEKKEEVALTPKEQEAKERKEEVEYVTAADKKADAAWMMVSTAFVMLMVPGLALFYGGMVRKKNILATMMHSMICLSVVGVFWMGIGYSLAFGAPYIYGESGSFLGFSKDLIFMNGIKPQQMLPNTGIPIYLHMLYQGMFAIITPALISGALAERIRFRTYLVFVLVWMVFVYCPLAHMVWALDWWQLNAAGTALAETAGRNAVGYLGKPNAAGLFALDFAGGTVVHISAGFASLACFIVLRKRIGYPQQAIHPSSMVLTLFGAGLLWFGWFGFNGGSGVQSGALAVSAFAATQAAAAAAGLSWVAVEWIHRGKPTGLGLASGIVAGLVAVTPASGFVLPHAGLIIGLISGVVCYVSVNIKAILGYDDSLDAFGVHGVGGFLGAILTGMFCNMWTYADVNVDIGAAASAAQVAIQFKAAMIAAVLSFVVSFALAKGLDILMGFTVTEQEEIEGLDRTEHGETGFDFGLAMESASIGSGYEPKSAALPPNGFKKFQVVVDGVDSVQLRKVWSELCQPNKSIPAEFKEVYPFITTLQGTKFQFRGGDQEKLRSNLQKLLADSTKQSVKTRIEA